MSNWFTLIIVMTARQVQIAIRSFGMKCLVIRYTVLMAALAKNPTTDLTVISGSGESTIVDGGVQ